MLNIKTQLIYVCIIAILYCFSLFPIPSTVISVTLIVSYVLFTRFSKKIFISRDRLMRREAALSKASMYLGKYTDIWRNLTLSNEYCKLSLGYDGMTISGAEKPENYSFSRSFKVLRSEVYANEELWNMFCEIFSIYTTYEELVKKCRLFRVVIEESVYEKTMKPEIKQDVKPKVEIKRVDINNCSEQDLTELPGISVIMAKKAIKKREEIGGFKNTEEFFEILNLKQHMCDNLKGIVFVTEMKNKKVVERYDERNVDL